jgi:transcription elongation factor GreA
VIDATQFTGSTVRFGATVTLADEDNDDESIYQIVGQHEADISAGRLSVHSPLARALIGKQVGDSVEVSSPGGSRSYEVVDVRFG